MQRHFVIHACGKEYYMATDYVWRFGRWVERIHFGDKYPQIVFHIVNKELLGECYTYGNKNLLNVAIETLFILWPRKIYIKLRDNEYEKSIVSDSIKPIQFIQDVLMERKHKHDWYHSYKADNPYYYSFMNRLSCKYKETSFVEFKIKYMKGIKRLWPRELFDVIQNVYDKHSTYKGFFLELLETYGTEIGYMWMTRFFKLNMTGYGSGLYTWKIYKSEEPLCIISHIHELLTQSPMAVGWRHGL